MLTTTLDGLWVLQVLSGIEVLAPELGLRPHLPRTETTSAAMAHPVTAELTQAGVISATGAMDDTVLEWLTVLSRRDIALLLQTRDAGDTGASVHTLLARFDQWWVALERSGDLIRLSGVATATREQSAGLAITSQIDRLCGPMPASLMRPVTLNTSELLSAARDFTALPGYLRSKRLEPDQVRTLTLAAQPERSRQTSVVAIQSGVRPHIETGALTVIDTPEGRLLTEHVVHDGTAWMVITPGSTEAVASAVQKLMRRLPASTTWHSYRKAV